MYAIVGTSRLGALHHQYAESIPATSSCAVSASWPRTAASCAEMKPFRYTESSARVQSKWRSRLPCYSLCITALVFTSEESVHSSMHRFLRGEHECSNAK